MDAYIARASSITSTAGRKLAAALTLTAMIVALLLVPAFAGATPQPAQSADSFVNSIGVNTHTYYTNTAYGQFGLVKQRLEELGVRHIREYLEPNRLDQYKALNELAGVGIKSDLILGDPPGGATGLNTLTSTLKTKVPNAVDTVEGSNEFDLSGTPNWASSLTEYQRRLYNTIKSDPSLSSLPVVGPSMGHSSDTSQMGNISSLLDYGNIHSYPGGYGPEGNLTSQLGLGAQMSGTKPVMATETGYHNALNTSNGHLPTSEVATAVYMPRLFLEYFRRGVARTYSYELVDEWPDPGLSESESHFGLLRNDFSKKPAFVAMHNLIQILEDPGPSFTPEALDYTLSGNQENLHQVLLQKRDGSYYLALWRATSVWDPVNRTALSPTSAQVNVTVNRSLSSAQQFEPNASSAPLASFSDPNGPLGVRVGPQVVILKLSPTPETAAPTAPAEPEAPAPIQTPEATPETPQEPALQPAPEPSPQPAPAPAPAPAPVSPTPSPTPSPPSRHQTHHRQSRAKASVYRQPAQVGVKRHSARLGGAAGHNRLQV